MAEEIKIKVDLEATAKDIEALKGKNAFNAQQLSEVERLLKKAREVEDPTKLKGPALTEFDNTIHQLSEKVSKAAARVVNVSEEYAAQMKKVSDAQVAQSKAQGKLEAAQEKKANAIAKYDVNNHTFKNTKTGGTLTAADSIAQAYTDKVLAVYNKAGKRISGTNYNSFVQTSGIADLASANQDVKQAQIEVDQAEVTVKKEQDILDKTDPGGGLSPEDKGMIDRATKLASDSASIRATLIEAQKKKNEDAENAKALPETRKDQSSFGKAFKQFSLYAITWRLVKQAGKEAIRTITDLDKALTDQAMVTGMTRKQTKALLSDYQNLAAQLGTTTKEIAGVATEFIRQGKSITEALTLTEAAVSAAKVAGISGAESVNYLTTALNGFQLAATDALKVSDKFAAIAATSATSYEELATALSKVASQANLAGMSIDYTTALLAKGIETTREAPETIGTALKTIIARMRELTDYGATLEGDTDVNNVETQLAYVGIALKDANGELRSTQDVLDDLGKKWDTLNSNQQAAIAKALAGTRQQSRLIAMMSDYERVTELQQVAERSNGATMAQMEKYSDSLEAAINRVTASWEKFITSITNSDFIIGFVNQLAKAVENLSTSLGKILSLSSLALVGGSKLATNINNKAMARAQEIVNRKDDLKKAQTEFDSQKDNKDKAQKEYDDLINNKATEKTDEDIKQTSEYKEQQENILELQKTQNELETINVKIKEVEAEQLEKGNALEAERNALIEKQTALIEVKNAQLERQKAIESGDEAKIAEAKKADSVARGKLTKATKKAANASEKANLYKTDARKLEILEKKQAQAIEKINQIKQKEIDIDKKVVAKRKELISKNKILVAGDTDALEAKQKLTDATDSYLIAQDQLKVVQDQMNKINIVSNAITAAKNILIGIANTINAFALVTTKAQNKIIQKNTELKVANNLQTEIGAATAGVATGTNLTLAASFKAVGIAIKSIPILG